jgi:beta-lactamase class D
LLAGALAFTACSRAPEFARSTPEARDVDLGRFFEGIDPADAAFVVFEPATGTFIRHNPERARTRFLPASTFKIPNTLIALETGVASGADFTLKWDSLAPRDSRFWPSSWSRDHTLRTAMDHSVVWFYQELARRIGPRRMQQYLDRFDYGNRSIGGGLDRFWLSGDLRISPDEQVAFLYRMLSGDLGLSPQTLETLRDLIVLDDTPGYRISGKTGTADVTPTRELAWLVGFVEREGGLWIFALNMEGEEVWERWGARSERLRLIRALLGEVGAMPENSE